MAAGRGSRLSPLSNRIPKPLIHCAGRPIIHHLISALIKSKIEGLVVGLGWKANSLQQFLSSEIFSLEIQNVIVPDYERGPLKTFVTASSKLGNEPFVVCPADLVSVSSNIENIVRSHLHDEVLLSLAVAPTLEIGTKVYGDENGLITGVGEGSEGKFLGSSAQIIMADNRFVEFCSDLETRGFNTISEVINELSARGRKMRALPVSGYWKDIDTVQALLDANRHLLCSELDLPSSCVYVPVGDSMEFGQDISLGSEVMIHAGTKILGPSLVMPESTILADSVVGPNVSLSEGTKIGASSSIENAIVFGPGTTGIGTSLSNVIIFKNKVIKGDKIE